MPLEAADQEEIPREDLAPVIMRGHWRLDQRQRSLFARLRCTRPALSLGTMHASVPSSICASNTKHRCADRSHIGVCSANKRVMLVVVGVALLAAANAILVPISMEAAVQVRSSYAYFK